MIDKPAICVEVKLIKKKEKRKGKYNEVASHDEQSRIEKTLIVITLNAVAATGDSALLHDMTLPRWRYRLIKQREKCNELYLKNRSHG